MITGRVSKELEAAVPLAVRGPTGNQVQLEAIVDTGFTEDLTLSPSTIATLQLFFRETCEYTLADGAAVHLDVYRGIVVWDGQERSVLVTEAEGGSLVGMGLMRRQRLTMDIVEDGPVTIQSLG